MEMPRVGEQHKRLEAMAGTFAGGEMLHPGPFDPQGGQATSECVTRMDLDGFVAITDFVQKRFDKVSYRGHGVYGWDPRQEKYFMYWFDSMGGNPPAAYGTFNGNVLTFESSHHMGHSRYTYTFKDDGSYTLKIEFSQDGKSWMPFLDGTYRKAG